MLAIDDTMKRLAAPFSEQDLEWRVQASGKKGDGSPWVRIIPYIRNTAVMQRLDDVVSAAGWQNKFEQFDGGIICGISIRVGEVWVTKWDGAPATQTEPFKGALSGSMKRAANQWGIGRYLHDIGEHFAEFTQDKRIGNYLKANPEKHGAALYWLPPKLPAKYLPATTPQTVAAEATRTAPKAAPMAEAVAAVAGATVMRAGAVKLPGTKAALMGFGGQPIAAVPREHLPEIRAKLDQAGNYRAVIEAINDYLEATRLP